MNKHNLVTVEVDPAVYKEYRKRLLDLGRTVKDDIAKHMKAVIRKRGGERYE